MTYRGGVVMNRGSSVVRIAAATISVCLAALAVTESSRPAAAVQVSAAPAAVQQRQVGLQLASIDSLRIIAARPLVDAAQAVLASSENHTNADGTLQKLSGAIARANADLTRTMSDLAALAAGSTTLASARENTGIERSVAAGMRDFSAIEGDLGNLAAAQSAVEASVAARTAALQEAARVAAQSYHLTVWTSGFQTQLNACRGAVDLTSAYGVRTIGEKWECGGARFPGPGSLVSLSGIFAGLYRVGPTVAVLSAYTNRTGDIPRGYPLLYQTCRNGNAHTETFAELIPVQ
jgi:hypothetical protein